MIVLKIGLVGKMRSGKDTVADILETKGFVNYKFSQGIKDVKNLLDYNKKDGKDRKMLQNLGQGLRQIVGEDVWIHYTLDHVMSGATCENILISDCRQPNEAETLRNRNYWLVKVHTDEKVRIQRMSDLGDVFTLEDLCHETEVSLDTIECDFIITNDGTLQELNDSVEVLYNYLSWMVDDYGYPLKPGSEVNIITVDGDYESVVYKHDPNNPNYTLTQSLYILDDNYAKVDLLSLMMDGKLLSIETVEEYAEIDEDDDYEFDGTDNSHF